MNGITGYISILEASYKWAYRNGASINTAPRGVFPAFPVLGAHGRYLQARKSPPTRAEKNKQDAVVMITDETLYRRYVNGDDEGLNVLMERYDNSLIFYINGYLHDLHEAEDLMIEAFSYLIAKKPNIKDGGFRGYLYKTARHLALRHKTRNRLRQAFSFDDLEADAES